MTRSRSTFHSIFRNVSMLTLGRILTALCSFVYMAFAVRALGLADFGLLILIHSLAMTGSTLSRLQTWQTLIRFGSDAFFDGEMGRFRQVVSFCIRLDGLSALVALVLSLVVVILYAPSVGWTHHERTLALLYACVAPFMYTGWCHGVLRLAGRFRLVPITDGFTAFGKMCGVLLAYALHLGVGWFLFIWAAAVLFDYGLYTAFALSILRRRASFGYFEAFRHWRWKGEGMWAFTRGVSLNQTLASASTHVATLIVGKQIGTAEAAIFRVCRQIASGIVTPAQLISPVLYPELVKMRDRQDWAGLRKVTLSIFGILLAISAFLILLTAVAGSQIFRALLHVHVSHTSFYITMMLLAAIFSLLIVPLEPLLIVTGQLRLLVRTRVFVTLLYFPALYLLTRYFHLTGACLATLASSAGVFLSCLVGAVVFSRRLGHSGQSGAEGAADQSEPAQEGGR